MTLDIPTLYPETSVVNTLKAGQQWGPWVLQNKNGATCVTWINAEIDEVAPGVGITHAVLKVQIYNPQGQKVGSEFRAIRDSVQAYGDSYPWFQLSERSSDGAFCIQWHRADTLSAGVQFISENAEYIGEPRYRSQNVFGDHQQAYPWQTYSDVLIAPLTGGGFVTAWKSSSGSIAVQFLNDQLEVVGDAIEPITSAASSKVHSLVPLGDGGFVVTNGHFAWTFGPDATMRGNRYDMTGGTNRDVYAFKFDDDRYGLYNMRNPYGDWELFTNLGESVTPTQSSIVRGDPQKPNLGIVPFGDGMVALISHGGNGVHVLDDQFNEQLQFQPYANQIAADKDGGLLAVMYSQHLQHLEGFEQSEIYLAKLDASGQQIAWDLSTTVPGSSSGTVSGNGGGGDGTDVDSDPSGSGSGHMDITTTCTADGGKTVQISFDLPCCCDGHS